MPIYYRNKIYSEEEREKLWIQKLNSNTRYILGEKIDISKGEEYSVSFLSVVPGIAIIVPSTSFIPLYPLSQITSMRLSAL